VSRCRIRKLGDFAKQIDTAPVGRRVYLDGPYGAFTVGRQSSGHACADRWRRRRHANDEHDPHAEVGDFRGAILLCSSKDWNSITFREELEELKMRSIST
jgi:hypothetical protein